MSEEAGVYLDDFTAFDLASAADWCQTARAGIDGTAYAADGLVERTAAAELSRCLHVAELALRRILDDGQALTPAAARQILATLP